MRKVFKLVYICLIFLLCPLTVLASNIEITSFESSIKVARNRVASVSERYEVYFIENTKEFLRTLDNSLKVQRPDKSSAIIKPSISKIKLANEHIISERNKKKIINIKLKGNKDTTNKLSLSYKYDLGKDEVRRYDEFYYNIISNFDNIISDVSFEVILPSKVDKKDITFFLNGEIVDESFVLYDVEKNIITGYLNRVLNEKDNFSIHIKLPKNYFIGAKDKFNYFRYLFLLLPLIALGLVIYCWFKYAKGNKIKREASFLPPHNFAPSEVAYLYKGKTVESDITADLLSLANAGYIKVEENDDGYKLGKENSFNMIKVKEYKGRNAIQMILFKGVFRDRTVSTLSDIEYTIKGNLMDAKKLIDNSDNKEKLFNKDINKFKKIILGLIAASILLLTLTPVKEFTDSYLLVPVLTGTMLFGIASLIVIDTGVIPRIILSLIFVGGTVGLNIYSLEGQEKLMLIYILGVIIILLTSFIYSRLPQRTKYGNKCMGEVEGFRNALLNMNPNKLQDIMRENPNYYYDMIPYVLVLDLIDQWTSLGSKIITDRPTWHISVENFTLKKEIKFFKNFIFVTTQVLIKGLYNQKETQQVEFKKDVPTIKANEN